MSQTSADADRPLLDRSALQSMFDLTDRVAIVTGGTRGIGFAIAEGFVAAGAKVVVASRKPEACASAAARLAEGGGDVLGVPCHLGDLDAVDNLVTRTVEHFGGLDVVVNNAANALTQPLGSFTAEAWAKSFDVNLRGPVFLLQAALPHLRTSEHAAVLNVVSAGAYLFSNHVAMYAAGKAALVSFTKSMAAEFAPYGIRVNALAPGAVDTDMVRATGPAGIEMMAGASLVARLADPREMIGSALLLCSDAGSFITGQTIHADGGLVPR